MPGPSVQNLVNEYVDTIPVLPSTVTSGNSAFNHYLLKHRFSDISLFNNDRFSTKIKKVSSNSVEEHNLWTIANRVNLKAQSAFDKSNPKWYIINRPIHTTPFIISQLIYTYISVSNWMQSNFLHPQDPSGPELPRLKCAFHSDSYLTNFCSSKECLLPLCPSCIKIHINEHINMQSNPQL